MRKPDITVREALLWAVLVTAVGVLVSVVTRKGTPSRNASTVSAADRGATVSPLRHHLVRADSIPPDGGLGHDEESVVHADKPSDNDPATVASAHAGKESGFEMPFAPDETGATEAAMLPDDPAGLCAALRDALTNGRGAEVSAVRGALLALGPVAVPHIAEMLQSRNEPLALEAARLLVQIGDAQGLALALGKLLTVPRESPSYSLFLAAFADNRSAAVAKWLTDTLGKAQYADTRDRMLDLLYAMRGPEAVAALEQTAIAPADEMHAQDSVDSIAMRHDPAETESLAAMLGSEHQGIREAAALGLAEVGNGAACQELAARAEVEPACGYALGTVSSSYAQETLLAMATDRTQTETVRMAAIQSLAGHSGYRVQTVLANAAVQEANPTVAQSMQTAVNTINNNQVEARNNTPVAGCDNGELWF